MSIFNALQQRRSYYKIGKDLPVSEGEIEALVKRAAELVPDAFNMKSSRVVLALGTQHDRLWDTICDVFGGKVPREKIDSFKAGAGTVLYFYDAETVKALQEKFPAYAANFPVWANQSSGMLQLAIWSALRELGVGASLQHYKPVIDTAVKELFSLPENFVLVAQMPFGAILEEPAPKEKENINERVFVRQ
ncbi:MAG: nitroreductase family protein [Pyramidobacter sp.]|nr:nitroreductase family protein [Pyramidobacter sp.]